MDYSPEAFAALHEEVERQHGTLLPDLCVAEKIVFLAPLYKKAWTSDKTTCYCNNRSRFVNVYELGFDAEGRAQKKRGAGFVTSCAVCDNMGAWPRFEDAVYAADPDLDPLLDDDEPEEPIG